MRKIHALIVSACFAAALPGELVGQVDPRLVTTEGTCKICRIRLHRVVRLGGGELPISIGPIARVGQANRGELFVGSLMELGPYARFTASGEFRGLVGRRGSGPGEFGLIGGIHRGRADSIVVLEASRLTVMSDEGQVGRLLPLAGRMVEAWPLPTGGFLTEGVVPRGRGFLPAFQILDPRGRVVRSFGPAITGAGEYMPAAVLSQHGSVWAAVKTADGYRIESWDTAGQVQERAFRPIDWAALARIPEPPRRRLPPEWTPGAGIQAVALDSRERLWVSLLAPSEDYWDHAPPRPGRTSDMDRQYDSIVEIIDLAEMRLVASERVDGYIIQFLPDGSAVSRTLDPATGEVLVDVSRVLLQRAGGR